MTADPPPPPPTLQRIMLDYVASEDRLRLTGAVATGPSVVLWLTRRLTLGMIPHLLAWLEKHGTATAAAATPHRQEIQSFAQEAARASLKPSPTIRSNDESPTWLASVIEISSAGKHFTLLFRSQQGQQARLVLDIRSLRQTLIILHTAWTKSGWPMDPWPAWFTPEGKPRDQETAVH